ncbi:MAG TPA: hypothetical protein VD839_16115 [Burkholderiales bacterium]|nr:hypothetical protein [Burkholderiales bacterium]
MLQHCVQQCVQKLLGVDVCRLQYAHVYGAKPASWFSVTRLGARDWEVIIGPWQWTVSRTVDVKRSVKCSFGGA